MVDKRKGLAQLAKDIKNGAMMMLSEKKPVEVIPTGIATLDAALGVGGLVRGAQCIIWGKPGAGKSSLCYMIIGNAMKRDPECMACIIDIERSTTVDYLTKFGVDPERTAIIIEPTVEDAVNTSQKVMRSNVFDFVVVDSVGAVIRAVDFDGKDGKGGDALKQQVGGASQVITRWVNKMNSELTTMEQGENLGNEVVKPVVIYINQVRANLKSMYGGDSMPGGNALEHAGSIRIKVTASGAANDKLFGTVNGEKQQVGTRVNCMVERNKYAPERRAAGYNFCSQECPEHQFGIDSVTACLDLAISYGVMESRGAWCFYGEEGEPGFVKANGRAAMLELLRDNPEFYEKVYDETMKRVFDENEDLMQDAESQD